MVEYQCTVQQHFGCLPLIGPRCDFDHKSEVVGLRAVLYITALQPYHMGPVTVPLKTLMHPPMAVHDMAVSRISL